MGLGPARREMVGKPAPSKPASGASLPSYLRTTRSQSSRNAAPREFAGRRAPPPAADFDAGHSSAEAMDGVSRIESSSASQSGACPALLTRTPSKPKAVDELREILSASKQSAAKQSAARRAAAASPKAAAAAVSPLIKFTPPQDAPAADSPHVRSSRGRFNKLLSSKLSSCRKRSRGDPAALGAPSEGLFDFDEAEDADGVANGAKAAKTPPRAK